MEQTIPWVSVSVVYGHHQHQILRRNPSTTPHSLLRFSVVAAGRDSRKYKYNKPKPRPPKNISVHTNPKPTFTDVEDALSSFHRMLHDDPFPDIRNFNYIFSALVRMG
ncbi:hypothetical protein Tsubulata_031074, partial [Turnera subulata]